MDRTKLHQSGVTVSGGKRAADVTIAAVGLLILSPLLLLLSLAVAILLGRPVLFRQRRPGLHGRPFELLKFRSMTNEVGVDGKLLPDAVRLTAFGRLLRSTSLDELPELINVLRGEMSLVGPRPLLPQYMGRYSAFQSRRHEVVPGITGWAQINGRNALSWEEKFAMDVWYVDHRSLGLDLKIIARTVWKMITREGVDGPGVVGASEFLGSDPGNGGRGEFHRSAHSKFEIATRKSLGQESSRPSGHREGFTGLFDP